MNRPFSKMPFTWCCSKMNQSELNQSGFPYYFLLANMLNGLKTVCRTEQFRLLIGRGVYHRLSDCFKLQCHYLTNSYKVQLYRRTLKWLKISKWSWRCNFQPLIQFEYSLVLNFLVILSLKNQDIYFSTKLLFNKFDFALYLDSLNYCSNKMTSAKNLFCTIWKILLTRYCWKENFNS